MNDSQVSPEGIMQLGFGFWGSKALLSAVELGLFSELAGGALDGDCCDWMQEAGFRDTYVEHLAGPDSMVVGTK
ncbi:MAG: hypothetical protein QOD13_3529 [Thermoleophilaceae bacterium]|jgi:hypothetical protein|nr:hypothetical protein [Thermoleophilaceae bacterium]